MRVGGDAGEAGKVEMTKMILENGDLTEDFMEDCPDCDGYGYVEGDCFEDTCCCADPLTSHGLVKCETCGGRG